MADSKISALGALTAPAADDELVIVDKSDTTQAASGTSKRIARDTLVPPTAAVYRTLPPATATQITTGAVAATNYLVVPNNNNVTAISNANASAPAAIVPILAADLAVSGLTTKLRLQVTIGTIATAPAVTYTSKLYDATSSGNNLGAGSAVAGSTVTIASPGANGFTTLDSGDFAPPSDGTYLVVVTVSGTPAGSVGVAARLQVRNV